MSKKYNCKCMICNTEVYRNPNNMPKNVTCSKKCRSELNILLNHEWVICENCGTKLHRKKSRNTGKIFCNQKCSDNFLNKVNKDDAIKYHNQGLYDFQIAEIFNCSRSNITNVMNKYNKHKNRKEKLNNLELRKRISNTNKGKRTGKENHNYKGKSEYTAMARGLFNSISKQYMLDKNYTCEECNKRGGDLEVHHIKQFSDIVSEFLNLNKNIPKDKFSKQILEYNDFIDTNNLILLCKQCHLKKHRNNGDNK